VLGSKSTGEEIEDDDDVKLAAGDLLEKIEVLESGCDLSIVLEDSGSLSALPNSQSMLTAVDELRKGDARFLTNKVVYICPKLILIDDGLRSEGRHQPFHWHCWKETIMMTKNAWKWMESWIDETIVLPELLRLFFPTSQVSLSDFLNSSLIILQNFPNPGFWERKTAVPRCQRWGEQITQSIWGISYSGCEEA
jgi:hypothetical protein